MIVMTLIAVPFAVTTGRRGAMYGIVLAIVLLGCHQRFRRSRSWRRDDSPARRLGAQSPFCRRGELPAADSQDVGQDVLKARALIRRTPYPATGGERLARALGEVRENPSKNEGTTPGSGVAQRVCSGKLMQPSVWASERDT